MVLIYARLLITGNKKNEAETLREETLTYSEILKQVETAVAAGYELAHIFSDESMNAVTFLKYKAGDKAVMIIAIRGTREEIEKLQEDPSVKNSNRNR